MFICLRKSFILAISLIAVIGFSLFGKIQDLVASDGKLNVVTSTTFFADLVRKIGGEKVDVKSVASPKFNVHFIQPKPSDVRNVMKADLYVFAGLDLELWSDPLVEAAGKPKLFRGGSRVIDLSTGIRLLEVPTGQLSRSQGDVHLFGNPHYQMNPENVRIMAETILNKLKEIDPPGASHYEGNKRNFISKLDQKIDEWKALCSHCVGREIASYHKDSEYLADFLGVKIGQYVEPKPGIPPTPKHIQFLEEYMKKNNIKIIVHPTYYPIGAAEAVAERAGGKTVTLCQNVGELPNLTDHIALMDFNVKQLSEALKTS